MTTTFRAADTGICDHCGQWWQPGDLLHWAADTGHRDHRLTHCHCPGDTRNPYQEVP